MDDGGNKRFIAVQLPEIIPPDTQAYINGYSTIVEIGKERIRRALKKIESETPRILQAPGYLKLINHKKISDLKFLIHSVQF